MGWNSWNHFQANIDERLIAETAEAMVRSGMRDAGYRYVVIDDAWHAPSRDEIIFTKNASEALNLVANTLAWAGAHRVGEGDEVLITEMEHHSNIVPWQLLTERKGATLRWFGLTDEGRLDLTTVAVTRADFVQKIFPASRIEIDGAGKAAGDDHDGLRLRRIGRRGRPGSRPPWARPP